MIQGIAFDMDGVLFDTESLCDKAWYAAAGEMGYEIPPELIRESLGSNAVRIRSLFAETFGRDFDFDAFEVKKKAYMTAFIEKNGMPLKPGLRELLEYLQSQRYAMAVATSTEAETVRYYFQKAGISDCFSHIVCGDMIEHSKPEPDIYLKACELMGLPPENCLALEDSPNGLKAAFRAGMKPVMIPDLIPPSEETDRLLFAMVPTLSDVIGLLERLS